MGEQALREAVGGESGAFFRTSRGTRFVDQFSAGIAHESKVGYQSLSGRLQEQIAKDAELMETRHFYRGPVTGRIGPSLPLLQELNRRGTQVIIY